MASGAGTSILLAGPAGAGKSRLVEAFTAEAQLAGVPVVVGRPPGQGIQPHGPFIALVLALKACGADPALLAPHAPYLARLIPELGASAAPPLDLPERELQRIREALLRVLVDWARARPFVAVLEDWDLADAPSRAFWSLLRRVAPDAPILWLIAARQPLGLQDDVAVEHRIAPLSPAEARQLLSAMLGQDELPEALQDVVALDAFGQPGALTRLANELVRGGVLVMRGARWEVGDPAALRQQVEARTAASMPVGLGPASERMLRSASLFPAGVAPVVLARATGLADEAANAASSELVARGVVALDAQGHLTVCHDELRERLEASLTPDERLAVHAAAADVLVAGLEGDLATAPLAAMTAFAHHALKATITPRALEVALAAATRLRDEGGQPEAEALLRAGRAALALVDAETRERLGLEFAIALADVLRAARNHDEPRALLTEALEALGDRDPARSSRLLTSLGKVQQMRASDLQAVLPVYDEAVALAERSNDPLAVARPLRTRGRAHLMVGNGAAAIADLGRSVEVARACGDLDEAANGEALHGYVLAEIDGRMAEGCAVIERACQRMEAARDIIGMSSARMVLADLYLQAGNLAAAREILLRTREYTRFLAAPAEEKVALANMAYLEWLAGDYPAAATAAYGAIELGDRTNTPYCTGLARVFALASNLARGMTDGAIDEIQALARERLGFVQEAFYVRWTASDALVELGLHERAEALYPLLSEAAEGAGGQTALIVRELVAIELASGLARVDGPIQRLEALLGDATRAELEGLAARVRLALAAAHQAAGRPAAARSQLEAVLDCARRLGARPMQAQALYRLGLLASEAQLPEAPGCFEALQALALDLGAPLWLARARFGLARARPDTQEAATHLRQAREALETMLAPLSEEQRAAIARGTGLAPLLETDART